MTTYQKHRPNAVNEAAQKQSKVKPARPGLAGLTPAPDLALLQRAIADPASARPADILALQRLAGNRAVTRLIQSFGKLPGPLARTGRVQAKLTVGPAGDRYEQEADRVAEQVVSGQPSAVPGPRGAPARPLACRPACPGRQSRGQAGSAARARGPGWGRLRRKNLEVYRP